MIRIATPVLALVLAAAPALSQQTLDTSNLLRASNLTDGAVYSLTEGFDEAAWLAADYNAVDASWEQVGEVEDVILDTDGQLVGVLVEVGGFLDIGDADVFLTGGDVRLVPTGEEYAVVTRFSEEELEAMEGVDEDWLDDD